MLTNNFYLWQLAAKFSKGSNFYLPHNIKDVTGMEKAYIYPLSGNYLSQWASISSVSGNTYLTTGSIGTNNLWIGSGTAEESKTDNEITPITDGITSNNPSSTVSVTENGTQMQISQTFTNTGSDDVVISEIGWFKALPKENSTTGCPVYLMARQLFDIPVTIPAGVSKTLNMVISVDSGIGG